MSSFGYLRHLPVELPKIVGSVDRNIEYDPMDPAMVTSIHEIARPPSKPSIAECVENQAIFDILAGIGIGFRAGIPHRKALAPG